MTPDEVQRYARQIALPEVGPEGQSRLLGARVLVVGAGAAAETTATYLRAAGVGEVIARASAPQDGAAWLAALAEVDLVVRVGFDDDAMLGAAQRLGLPVVVARATPAQVDLLSFPRRAPAPEASLEIPAQTAAASTPGAADVVAGTLAAAEALVRLCAIDGDIGRVRHLRLPLDGGAPVAQEIGVA
jgi:cation diffusion facilitator CzcD-associated flavoprotein CzcO